MPTQHREPYESIVELKHGDILPSVRGEKKRLDSQRDSDGEMRGREKKTMNEWMKEE